MPDVGKPRRLLFVPSTRSACAHAAVESARIGRSAADTCRAQLVGCAFMGLGLVVNLRGAPSPGL